MLYLPEMKLLEDELGYMIARFIVLDYAEPIAPITTGLTETQAFAVQNACTKKVSLLRGYAGTGKSTTMKRIVQSFTKAGMKGIALCPSAKASKRLSEVVFNESEEVTKGDTTLPSVSRRDISTATMHMGLGVKKNGGFKHDEDNYLDVDYVIVDESTMGGLFIMNRLMRAINPHRTRIVFTGDENQLPSVDSGNVFADMIRIEFLRQVYLTEIFRQGANSGIVKNAERVLQGKMPVQVDEETGERYTDIELVEREDAHIARDYIIKDSCVTRLIRGGINPFTDIQLIAPGKRGDVGTEKLNELAREKLNATGKSGFCGFRLNDKIINRRNNYPLNIVNGDSGVVKEIGTRGMTVNFGLGAGPNNDGIVEYNYDNYGNVHLAYCYTVHSTQGSQFPESYLPIYKTHWMLLFRNLLYTGMTRSKRLTLVYHKPALRQAVRNDEVRRRKTRLAVVINEWIEKLSKRA